MKSTIFYLRLIIFFFADSSLLIPPNETNIVANKDDRAVLPCLSTGNNINITLFKGVYFWALERVSATM